MKELLVIDGPTGVGKGTIAGLVAKEKGLIHIDSGLIYRAVAKAASNGNGEPPENYAAGIRYGDIDPAMLRGEDVGHLAAEVAKNGKVRLYVNAEIIRVARESGGAIIDGRAGVSEYPQARVKIYLYAELHVCAERRYEQLRRKGKAVYGDVLYGVSKRNEDDQKRDTCPLLTLEQARKPESGYTAVINSTRHETVEETLAEVLAVCDRVV